MEGLASLLLFAIVFFVMMRYGCGAHMMHGGHSHSGKHEGSTVDPVCGMQVEPSQGYSKAHATKVYRFCSRSCLDKFEREPNRYINSVPPKEPS